MKHLAHPGRVDPNATVYVVWLRGTDTSVASQNMGALKVDEDLNGSYSGITPLRDFELFVTAEATSSGPSPIGKTLLSIGLSARSRAREWMPETARSTPWRAVRGMAVLRSLKDLENYTLFATDGEIGTVVGFLLDDETWTIRYLVAETNGASGARDVLISPISFRKADWGKPRCFRLALTRELVRRSPGIDTDQPVSRQHEIEYYRYLGYSCYWGGSSIWGAGTYPALLALGRWDDAAAGPAGPVDVTGWRPPPARSAGEVRGYHVQGLDDAIGHIDDFIVDDESWEVRYLVIVDTGNWWAGRKVLVEPRWARHVSWEEGTIYFELSRQAIKDSPSWDETDAVNRQYEVQLYDYYGRPVYWRNVDRPDEPGPPRRADAGPA